MEGATMNPHYIRDTWDGKDPVDAVNNDPDFAKDMPRRFPRRVICLFVLAVIGAAIVTKKAHADACPEINKQSAHLCWTPPTQMNDGSAIASGTVITYTVYSGPKDNVGAAQIATTTALELVFSNLTSGEHCYAVTASIAGSKPSVLSSIACKLIRDLGPTDGSIVDSPT
jgi:hypothetical protein